MHEFPAHFSLHGKACALTPRDKAPGATTGEAIS